MRTDNVVMKNSKWTEEDLQWLFNHWGDNKPDYKHIHFSEANTLEQLMVEIEAYPSKSKSRSARRFGSIPTGWSVLQATKKHKLYIWNPKFGDNSTLD